MCFVITFSAGFSGDCKRAGVTSTETTLPSLDGFGCSGFLGSGVFDGSSGISPLYGTGADGFGGNVFERTSELNWNH